MRPKRSLMSPEVLMSDFHTWRNCINTTWLRQWRLKLMTSKFYSIQNIYWGHTSCTWLARQRLWTKVQHISMLFTWYTSSFFSLQLFGLIRCSVFTQIYLLLLLKHDKLKIKNSSRCNIFLASVLTYILFSWHI